MTKELRPYQQKAIDEIVSLYGQGKTKIVFQLSTGGGKTITASSLINRYVQRIKKNVLFVVHRDELLTQFRRTIYNQHGIIAEPIIAGSRFRNPKAQVYVTMIETANNRLKRNPNWFGDVGMVIIDECHIGSFNKIHQYFERDNILIAGLTATPMTASKKHPLNEFYQEIVCGIDTHELIQQGALVPNKTYHIKNVVRKDIKIRNGEFDSKAMFVEYAKGKHIENCVKAYEEKALGKKTIVFNCNIEHSELVNNAFLEKGHNSRHLDGATSKEERAEILKWFSETPGAILQNVGVLTAGFDEPSVECVIFNRSTLSLPLWLQCTGRGSRPFKGKTHFIIIDLGGNAIDHGDWSTPRDWHHLFHNPPKPGDKKEGVTPIKGCVKCESLISASSYTCEFCGAEQPRPEVNYDEDSAELELLQNSFDIKEISITNKQYGRSPYATLHIIKEQIVTQAKQQQIGMNETIAYNLLGAFQQEVRQWCKLEKKRYDDWHKTNTSQWFFEELKKQFNWELPTRELADDLFIK